jgi:hypothetical protein
MATAPLNCENDLEEEHVRPCVTSLACWWKEIRGLETSMGYSRSTLGACQAWDALLASEVPAPRPALYIELRACVQLWNQMSQEQRPVFPTLLDRFYWAATTEGLSMTEYAVLAAFRLRQHLCGVREN